MREASPSNTRKHLDFIENSESPTLHNTASFIHPFYTKPSEKRSTKSAYISGGRAFSFQQIWAHAKFMISPYDIVICEKHSLCNSAIAAMARKLMGMLSLEGEPGVWIY